MIAAKRHRKKSEPRAAPNANVSPHEKIVRSLLPILPHPQMSLYRASLNHTSRTLSRRQL
jgi:hypothetical protein